MSAWTPLVILHAFTASLALVLGAYALARSPRGDRTHRRVGSAWAALMATAALTSFGIRDAREGRLSALHALSVLTLVTLALGIRAARRRDLRAHKAHMLGSYLGLVGAFVGAVAVPERLVPRLVVGSPGAAAMAVLALVAAALLVLAWAGSRRGRRGAGKDAPSAAPRAPAR